MWLLWPLWLLLLLSASPLLSPASTPPVLSLFQSPLVFLHHWRCTVHFGCARPLHSHFRHVVLIFPPLLTSCVAPLSAHNVVLHVNSLRRSVGANESGRPTDVQR